MRIAHISGGLQQEKPKKIPLRKDPLAIARARQVILEEQMKYLKKHNLLNNGK